MYASGLHYTAIGDSLAAGQTPNREIGTGYADMIAMAIQPEVYSKELAVPGYTVDQVIKQVESDAGKRVIRSADLITISAGANDLLPLIQNDPSRGILTFNAITTAFALNGIREDYAVLLDKVEELNPDANVYVMGYYFPYPHVFDQHKPAVLEQLNMLNSIIKQEAGSAGAVFVPVADRFGTDAVDYLPNPGDVHPGPAGYLEMANAFLDVYATGSPEIPKSVLDQLPEPVTLAELREAAATKQEVQLEPAEEEVVVIEGCTKEEITEGRLKS
ncbi:SGNH/GDSL hydrolase family protein [Domibacillus mangrovi]|uniref:SGNH/GDSL hydrolase family protein n=1 Tax=Domibacillus mangrovi TaxID=1714354 RepID=UPI000B1B114F|nr:GDSL-type esterase/lipase family protein [Domibacillus mangrovi]